MSKYSKAIGAFLGSLAVAVPLALTTAANWWAVLGPVVAALAAYLAPKNTTK